MNRRRRAVKEEEFSDDDDDEFSFSEEESDTVDETNSDIDDEDEEDEDEDDDNDDDTKDAVPFQSQLPFMVPSVPPVLNLQQKPFPTQQQTGTQIPTPFYSSVPASMMFVKQSQSNIGVIQGAAPAPPLVGNPVPISTVAEGTVRPNPIGAETPEEKALKAAETGDLAEVQKFHVPNTKLDNKFLIRILLSDSPMRTNTFSYVLLNSDTLDTKDNKGNYYDWVQTIIKKGDTDALDVLKAYARDFKVDENLIAMLYATGNPKNIAWIEKNK